MTLTARSWIAEAPGHWTRGRLRNLIGAAVNGAWGDEPTGGASDVYCVRAADFDRTRQRVSSLRLPRRSLESKVLRQHMLRPGDLVLEKSGGGENQPVGAAVLFDLAEPAVCSNFCARIVPAQGIDSRFLTYVFAAAYGQGLTQSAIRQTTGIQNLDSAAFFASPWAFPEINDQRRIADFLDIEINRLEHMDRIRKKQIGLLNARVAAHRDSRVAALFDEWGTLPLRRVCTGISQGVSPQCDAVPAAAGEWGVLKLSSVKNGRFLSDENKRLPATEEPSLAAEVHRGDLLVTRANTPELVGDVAVVGERAERLLLPDLIYRVGLSDAVSSEFVAQVALSGQVRALVQSVARGTSKSMVKLRGEDIREWPVPCAPKSAQQTFIAEVRAVVDGTEKLRKALSSQRELLAERRQALLTAAVTGQIDVSTARGAEV